MKRRKFIQSSVLASALPLSIAKGQSSQQPSDSPKALYELRTYEMKFGANQSLLTDYLTTALQPALKRTGANHFMLFKEWGNSEPANLWVLISYPDSDVYLRAQNLAADSEFTAAAAAYHALPSDKAMYNRYSSMLLLALDGLPQLMNPVDGASLFELRTYEGYSEDATRRKIKMFNEEEIDLFLRVKLNPVFFGEMIAGPYRPCLTYMINFKDMEEHDANWKAFVSHPDWKAMSSKPEYADSVSNIRKLFLKPF
ncbi:MAG: NIPSNAP family protein [Saprospiraceae bacterium]|nr:NIPSNAP family protein [Saprospiraceae bacterium]MCF8248661.1 NIPSNAP family protein [Saprospiraceae bacterium]MCF8278849.1 NIPSNAP family protein [Bacteroidales bacterium]MCF8310649.1 NIPSNAP family protein [Saprospiraceae bacterium]MCF8439208.1 NIPSNAP family protein [Saprospiraceae bacterium]